VEGTLEYERKMSFDLLAEIVAANHAVRRRSYGASLKPELKRRSDGAFDETKLGFATFGRFLHAADEAGVIDVHKAARGPDWEAVPHGLPPVQDTHVDDVDRDRQHHSRVRADIWACFVDWRDGMRRAYHRSTGQAYMFPAEPRPGERPEPAAQRRLFEANPDEYVDMTPISFDTQIGWMRDFAESVDDTAAKEVLLFALGRDRPAREFTDALRAKPVLQRNWRSERMRRVLDVIAAWATENHLSLDPLESRSETAPTVGGDAAESDTTRIDVLRNILQRAIERMPESELLRISIPVEYLVGD
jgi:hypothetical protein